MKRAAIQALATCGTISAVEPLFYLKNFSLKSEAKEAIVQIQTRLGPSENGWLSLSGETSGNLSLSPTDEAGVMSLETDNKKS